MKKSEVAGKANKSDVTLTPCEFGDWSFSGTAPQAGYNWSVLYVYTLSPHGYRLFSVDSQGEMSVEAVYPSENDDVTSLSFNNGTIATRPLLGYQLGSQSDKPLASEVEVEVLRQGKADKPASFTTGNLAEFDSNGNPVDSGKSLVDIQSQIDTESPLLARSYAVQQQAGWGQGLGTSTSPVYFRPRYFGMKDGDLFKGIVLRTRPSGTTPFTGLYMRLKSQDGRTLGISEPTDWPSTTSIDVVFRLPKAVSLPSSSAYYTLDFSQTPDGAPVGFGMSLYTVSSGTNPDFYFAQSTLVPVATVQFYSWEELTGADIMVSPTDETKID